MVTGVFGAQSVKKYVLSNIGHEKTPCTTTAEGVRYLQKNSEKPNQHVGMPFAMTIIQKDLGTDRVRIAS